MPASVAMPAVRQNRSKLAPTCCQASSTIAAGKTPAGVVDLFMALLSFEDSAPRAYRLQVGNAYLTFPTPVGKSPGSRNTPYGRNRADDRARLPLRLIPVRSLPAYAPAGSDRP